VSEIARRPPLNAACVRTVAATTSAIGKARPAGRG
jgi:hypothetical protein